MRCVVGKWVDQLDTEDTIAFDQAADNLSRVDLYKAINTVFGKQYGLTALKDHLLTRCCCD